MMFLTKTDRLSVKLYRLNFHISSLQYFINPCRHSPPLTAVSCVLFQVSQYIICNAVFQGTALQAGRSSVLFPDGFTAIFLRHNPSGHAMVLVLTQPLTEMSTRNIWLGVKDGRCVGLTTLPPSCADCLEMWKPQPAGTLVDCPGLYKDCFTFLLCFYILGLH